MTKYIFITGGVVSSLGKGIAASSIGYLLQANGFNVKIRKFDPYLNIDPGTMSPNQHGEVFVTKDGKETDLDLGHYERFTSIEADHYDSVTAGKIYNDLLREERQGAYLGNTIQVIPHVTNMVKQYITRETDNIDFLICEIGGTVGDIEGLPFYDAIRQLSRDFGKENVLYVHLVLLPYIATAKELKTKPTQHSVKELRSIGIQPDILLCRADREIDKKLLKKISLFCDLDEDDVIPLLDQENIYDVPLTLFDQAIDQNILGKLNVKSKQRADLTEWKSFLDNLKNSEKVVNIGIVGKYSDLEDSYSSLREAIKHAAAFNKCKVNIKWMNARKHFTDHLKKQISELDGVIVPGGFGTDGTESKIEAISYVRENNIPFLGICLGMQLAAISIARDLIGIKDANSAELQDDCTKIIDLIIDKEKNSNINDNNDYGGTMRLGNYPCKLKDNSLAHKIYGSDQVQERHRHRYEFNNEFRKDFEKVGVLFSGTSLDGNLVEMLEIPEHDWFLGVQFHPEFKSKPLKAHPIFCSLIEKMLKRKYGN